MNLKLEIVAEAEAVKNNREIAHEYGISESMVHNAAVLIEWFFSEPPS